MKKRHIFAIVLLVIFFVAAFMGILVYAKLSLINRVDLDSDKLHVSDIFKKDETEETDGPAEEAENADEESPLSGFEIIALVGLDTRDASELANSDTMIFACLNHDEHSMRLFSLYRDTLLNIGDNRYRKANAAYCSGGPERFLSMVNLNLDLNVTRFITCNFNALATTIDLLGGLDIDMTREELIHMNNYNVETSEVCGVPYVSVPVPDDVSFDGYRTRSFHLTGTQSVSYARIRYTQGWDYKRTERQRLVLQKIKDKVKTVSFPTILKIADAVFPQITTNLKNDEILDLVRYCMSYDVLGECGFPFDKEGLDVDGMDCVVPVTLESNVGGLHEFIYPGVPYEASDLVKAYSKTIESKADGSFASEIIPVENDKKETRKKKKKKKKTEQTESVIEEEPEVTPTPEPEDPIVEPVEPEEPEPTPEPTPEPQPEPIPEPEPDPGDVGEAVLYSEEV